MPAPLSATDQWFFGLEQNASFGHDGDGESPPFNYVLIDDELRVFPQGFMAETRTGSSSLIRQYMHAFHSCLSRGAPVTAAGELRFVVGGLIWDNFSGHFEPGAASLVALSRWLRHHGSGGAQRHTFRVHYPRRCHSFLWCTRYDYELSEQQLHLLVQLSAHATIDATLNGWRLALRCREQQPVQDNKWSESLGLYTCATP